MTPRRVRPRTAASVTPGGNYTQLFVDLIDTGNAQAQIILGAIARHADWKTGVCYPEVGTIAEIARCSDRTVRRYLRRLESDGIIATGERFRDNGSRTSNEIELVGYEEWAAAIRAGGTVSAPKIVSKYADAAVADNDTPPDNLSGAPGQSVRGTPGQSVSTPPGQSVRAPRTICQGAAPDNLSGLELHLNLGRERESEAAPAEFEKILQQLRANHPACVRIVDGLIDPLLRQRKLNGCPDPVFALGEIVAGAAGQPDVVLADAVARVKAQRQFSFKTADLETALSEAAAVVRRTGVDSRPVSEDTAKVRAALLQHFGQAVYDAWFAGIVLDELRLDGTAVFSVATGFLRTYIDANHFDVLSLIAAETVGAKSVRIITRKPEGRA